LMFIVFSAPLHILDINPLSNEQLAKIFSYSVGCLFIVMVFPLMCISLLISCNFICQFLIFPEISESNPGNYCLYLKNAPFSLEND
jgi:hypothetical protein